MPQLRRLSGDKEIRDFIQATDDGRPRIAVIEFTADWCGPCKRIAPAVQSIADRLADEVAFAKVDADADKDLLDDYGVKILPTFVIVRKGKRVGKVKGADVKRLDAEVQALVDDK